MGATFSGFSVQSQNALTGGYALRFNGLFDSALTNVSADSANSSQTSATSAAASGSMGSAASSSTTRSPRLSIQLR